MAVPGAAAVEDVGADQFQHRPDLREQFVGGADHQGDGSRIGAADPARHRCIDEFDAMRAQLGRHRAGFVRIAGRLVDDDLAGRQPFQQPARPEDCLAHILRGRQAGHHDIAFAGQRRAVLRRDGALVDQGADRFGAQVIDAQRPRQLHPSGQRTAHIAKADITDIHGCSLPELQTRKRAERQA